MNQSQKIVLSMMVASALMIGYLVWLRRSPKVPPREAKQNVDVAQSAKAQPAPAAPLYSEEEEKAARARVGVAAALNRTYVDSGTPCRAGVWGEDPNNSKLLCIQCQTMGQSLAKSLVRELSSDKASLSILKEAGFESIMLSGEKYLWGESGPIYYEMTKTGFKLKM